jgi:hypothetical protein
MSVESGQWNFYTYWLVPRNLTGIPGPKSTPRAMFYQQGNHQRFQFIPRWNANIVRSLLYNYAGVPPQVPPDSLFGAVQRYENDRAGIPQAHIIISGEIPLQATYGVHPQIYHATVASSGGGMWDGQSYWFMWCLYTANGLSEVSLPFSVYLGGNGSNGNVLVTLDGLILPPDPDPKNDPWIGYRLYIHNVLEHICQQSDVSFTAGQPPTSISYSGLVYPGTSGPPLDVGTKVAVRGKVRIAWHSGVAGVRISAVGTNLLTSLDLITSVSPSDNWTGRDCTVLGPATVDSPDFGLMDFTITAFDGTTGALSVTPDPVTAGVQVDMALVLRTHPDLVGADYIGDSMMVNEVSIVDNPPTGGMAPEQEIGRLVFLFRGAGAGQMRQIVTTGPVTSTATSNTTLAIDKPWSGMPDSSTWFLVLDPAFIGTAPDATFTNTSLAAQVETVDISIPNIQDLTMFVEGYLVLDDQETLEERVEAREIFILARPPGVRVIGPDHFDASGNAWILTAEDQTIIVDTSANDVTLQLCPLIVYQGRGALIYCDGTYSALVNTTAPDTFSDGSSQQTLTPGQTLRITAAGVFT